MQLLNLRLTKPLLRLRGRAVKAMVFHAIVPGSIPGGDQFFNPCIFHVLPVKDQEEEHSFSATYIYICTNILHIILWNYVYAYHVYTLWYTLWTKIIMIHIWILTTCSCYMNLQLLARTRLDSIIEHRFTVRAPVLRHLRALRKSPWKFIIWMNEL